MLNFLKGNRKMATTAAKADINEIIKVGPEALTERMMANNPNIFGAMPEKRSNAIIRNTLKALAEELDSYDEAGLLVVGLGRVNIRQVETSNGGEKVTVKRVVLVPAKPKS